MRRVVPLSMVCFLLLAVVLSSAKAKSAHTAALMLGSIRPALVRFLPMNRSALQRGIVTRMALPGQS
jgi:hypothetical protein